MSELRDIQNTIEFFLQGINHYQFLSYYEEKGVTIFNSNDELTPYEADKLHEFLKKEFKKICGKALTLKLAERLFLIRKKKTKPKLEYIKPYELHVIQEALYEEIEHDQFENLAGLGRRIAQKLNSARAAENEEMVFEIGPLPEYKNPVVAMIGKTFEDGVENGLDDINEIESNSDFYTWVSDHIQFPENAEENEPLIATFLDALDDILVELETYHNGCKRCNCYHQLDFIKNGVRKVLLELDGGKSHM